MHYLGDFSTAYFARKLGSKDKQKRNHNSLFLSKAELAKPVNARNMALLQGTASLGIGGIAVHHSPEFAHLNAGQKIALTGGLGAAGAAGGYVGTKLGNKLRAKWYGKKTNKK